MTCRLELEIRCLTGDKIVMYWYKTGFSSFKQVPFFLPGLPQLPSSSGLWPSALCPGAWPCHLPCKSGQLHFPPADVITCFHQHFLCAHQSKWGCASKSYEEVWCRWAVGAPIFNLGGKKTMCYSQFNGKQPLDRDYSNKGHGSIVQASPKYNLQVVFITRYLTYI